VVLNNLNYLLGPTCQAVTRDEPMIGKTSAEPIIFYHNRPIVFHHLIGQRCLSRPCLSWLLILKVLFGKTNRRLNV
jgi:hypothetical protein